MVAMDKRQYKANYILIERCVLIKTWQLVIVCLFLMLSSVFTGYEIGRTVELFRNLDHAMTSFDNQLKGVNLSLDALQAELDTLLHLNKEKESE